MLQFIHVLKNRHNFNQTQRKKIMAHEITLNRLSSKYEFAYSGEKCWHGLGAELSEGASIDTWKQESGLNWEVMESAVRYSAFDGKTTQELTFPDKRVLFRSDTKDSLAIVSADYHVVQPGEVLEFFRDITEKQGYSLSAAGSLFGGKRFWATANVGKSMNAVDDDTITGQLLLVTSVDGTLATQAKFVSTRVVCNNTLTIAMGETGKSVRKTHASAWDANAFKLDLGLIDSGWENSQPTSRNLPTSKCLTRLLCNFSRMSFSIRKSQPKIRVLETSNVSTR